METKREQVLAALRHEEGTVPSWTMAFFNIETARRLLGEENVVTDFLPEKDYKLGPADDDNRQRNLRFSGKIDNCAIGIGKGANFAFGHGGCGEFMERLIFEDGNRFISEFETGVHKMVQRSPHFYHNDHYPMDTLEEIERITLPDPQDAGRYQGLEEDVRFYREQGYFTYANLNGIFSGIHYFLYPYDKVLMDMLLEPEELHRLIQKLGEYNLTVAEHLLRTGIDCITFCDDLGDGRSMLFSPELYREMFFPYHKELADLCHSYGAFLHMHSHGNILKVFDDLVKAGIDMLNPLDPYEVGSMASLKEAYGDKITLVGGLDKFFFDWDEDTMERFLRETIAVGRKGGGFLLMDSGGIPENISREKFEFYVEAIKRLRK